MIYNTKEDHFVSEVLEIKSKGIGTDFIDAIVKWCDDNTIEYEVAAAWLKKHPILLSMVENDAIDLNLLPENADVNELPL